MEESTETSQWGKSGREDHSPRYVFHRGPLGGNACMVDVKDGKVLRIRPARFYDKYTKEEVKPWVMHARGKTFEPGDKTLPPPSSIAYKKRVFSPARIRYPMKRVDFDPSRDPRLHRPGRAQHPEPGREQVRAHQLGRSARHRHRRDAPHQGDLRPDRHPLPERPARREQDRARTARLRPQAARPVRRLHAPGPQRRQLGRLVLGGQARVGLRAHRPAAAAEEPALRHLQERRTPALLGLRPGDHHLGLGRPASQPAELLVDRTGHQADLHRPGLQLRERRARRQVDPRPAQHRRRPLPGHRPPLVRRGHLRQGVPRDPRLRRGQVRGLRHGRGRRRAQDPRVGRAHHRRARPHHQGPGRRMGLQAHHRRHRQRRPGHPRPLFHRAGPPAGAVPGHAGAGQAGLQPGQDDRVGARRRPGEPGGTQTVGDHRPVCRLPGRHAA